MTIDERALGDAVTRSREMPDTRLNSVASGHRHVIRRAFGAVVKIRNLSNDEGGLAPC